MPTAKVFIPRKAIQTKGLNIGSILARKEQKGEVGIEIEVEGLRIPHPDETPSPWVWTEDHSLRGEHAEFVLRNPVMFSEVAKSLKVLWEAFKKKKTKINDSNRTSVHIHLNCQNFYLNRLTSFLALYFICEEVLTEWCGDTRVGNLFCLRAKDAPAIIQYLKNFIQSNGESQMQEFLHYSGMNANALKKYGSLEVRTLRGAADPTIILEWVEILERLYKLSADYDDPRDICVSLSSIGPLAFFESILGDKATVVRKDISMSDHDIAESVYEGVRIAQDLCYCRDWDLYQPTKLKTDPFSRDKKHILNKIQKYSNFMNANPNADADLMSIQIYGGSPGIVGTDSELTIPEWTPEWAQDMPPGHSGEGIELDYDDEED